MTVPDYTAVLASIRPGSVWSMNNNDLTTLAWDATNETEPPTQADLDAAWPTIQTDRKWAEIRNERDRLLTATDWTQVADTPLTVADREGWAVYRQALRDIPQTQVDPDSVVWPAR